MMKISKILYLLFGILFYASCNSQVADKNTENDRLSLVSKIVLANVSGRIDHIAFDSVNHLAFIAALGNNTVEVVNIKTGQLVQTITGLHEPQGVAYLSSLKKLVVANGDNGDCIFFDAVTYKQSGVVHLKSDADNIRYEPTSQLLYVGYGDGAIAVIDPNLMKQVSAIGLDGHPESFQISKKQNRIYINVPDANEIEVAELATKKIIAKWKNAGASSNFPMAVDEENAQLLVGCRSPARLRVINSVTGKDNVVVSCSGDVDDVFFNAADSLVFLSAGKGFIDVFRASNRELVHINHIATRTGARTSLLLAREKKFLLAVPAHSGQPAALWIYNLD